MGFSKSFKKAMGRGSSSPTSSVNASASQSQDNSGSTTPAVDSLASMSPIDREHLTIDPRDNHLTQVESNATAKKKSAMAKLRSAMKKDDPYKDWPEHIYKPHEMPRPKYRRPVDPDHAETLNSYSLRSAFAEIRNRRSFLSAISPGASRLPSRSASFASRGGRSAAPSAGPSRSASIAVPVEENDEEDDDVSNVGLTRHPTNKRTAAIPIRPRGDTVTSASAVPDLVQSGSMDSDDTDSILGTSQTVTLGDVSRAEARSPQFGKPFDGEALTRAITSKLVVEH